MGYWARRKWKHLSRRFILEQLEERIVLDAAVPASTQDDMSHKDQATGSEAAKTATPEHAAEAAAAPTQAAAEAAASAGQSDPLGKVYGQDLSHVLITNALGDIQASSDSAAVGESGGVKVLVVSSEVQGATDLTAAALPGVVTILYDGVDSRPETILAALDAALAGQKAQSIAFATHNVGDGAVELEGGISLQGTTLTTTPEFQLFWSGVGKLLTDNGRIDLMACDLAATAGGELTISQIEHVSGHIVAASDDATGNLKDGGDWTLESGNVDLAATYFASDRIDQFQGKLETIDLSGSTGWKTVMTGTLFDPARDQQAQKATTDLSGDDDHGVLYTVYDDKGTSDTSDDEIGYRVRVGGADSGGSFSSVILLGIDADRNGEIDIFVTVQDVENGIRLWYPGGDLNISPNTTSTSPSLHEFSLTGNYNFSAVSVTTDPDWEPTQNTDVNLYNGPDYFVSFKLPFSAIQSQLAEHNVVGNPVDGVAIDQDSPLRYVLGTSTQTNAFNSDIGGVGAKDGDGTNAVNSTKTWEELGAFSPWMSASNMFPVITSDGGGATANKTVQTGNTDVTTVIATDQDHDMLSYSMSGGSDQSLFTINPVTGKLSFVAAPDYFKPLDSDGNNTYLVAVTVSDGKGGTDVQHLTVTVSNSGDTTAPYITQFAPADEAGNVVNTANLNFVFSENIKLTGATGNITIYEEQGSGWNSTPFQTISILDATKVSVLGKTLVIDPNTFNNGNKWYSVTFDSGVISDLAGNPFQANDPAHGYNLTVKGNQAGADLSYDFKIDSNVTDPAPAFVSCDQDGQTVSGSTNIVLNFNELVAADIVAGNGDNFLIKKWSDGSTLQTIAATDTRQVSISGSIVTIDPLTDLAPGEHYYVEIQGGALKDSGGNLFTGYTRPSPADTATCKTDFFVPGDTTSPTINSVTSDNYKGTWIEGDRIFVVVHFSEAASVTGTPQLTLETGAVDRVIDYTSGSGTNALRFTYTVQAGDHSFDLDYVATASLSGTIKDLAGNSAVLGLPAPGSANSISGTNGVENLVIDLTPVNHLADATVSTNEDNPLTFNAANSNLITVSDDDFPAAPPGDTLSVKLTVTDGKLHPVTVAGVTITGDNSSSVTISGTDISKVNQALDGLTFTPETNFNGVVSLGITTDDGQITPYGVKAQTTDSVTIAVTPVDDPGGSPLARNDTVVAYENTEYSGNVATNDFIGADGGLFSVDTTPGLGPDHGTVTLSESTGQFFYNPATGYTGGDSFTYKITDTDGGISSATVTINVLAGLPTVTVTATDPWASEAGNDPGLLTVDLGTAYYDQDVTVTYSVSGTAAAPADYTTLTGSVTVYAGQQTATINVAGIVDDALVEGSETVVVTLSGASGGHSFSTTPAAVTILDNDAANSPPVLSGLDNMAYTEGNGAVVIDTGITLTDSDSPNMASATIKITGNYHSGDDFLSIAATDLIGAVSSWDGATGTLTLTGTTSLANYVSMLEHLKYANTSGDPHTDLRTVTWTVNDGTDASAPQTSTITVTAVNTPPTDIAIASSTVAENQAVGTVVGNFSATDVDGGPTYTYALVDNATYPDNTAFTIDGNQLKTAASFDYETKSSYSIRVEVSDGHGGTYLETLTINVSNVNEPPTVTTPIPDVMVDEDAPDTVFSLYPYFQDAESSDGQLTYTVISNSNPSLFASVDISDPTNFKFDYADNANGAADITIRATDTGGLFVDDTFHVTVNSVNDPAVIGGAATGDITEDAAPNTVTGALTVSDVDHPDPDGFQAATTAGTYGGLTIGTSGAWTYTLDNGKASVQALAEGQTVTDTFTALSDDGASKSVTITVHGVNDAPLIDSTHVVNCSPITEDDITNSGNTVAFLVGASITDADAGSVQGIAIFQTTDGNGHWQYSIDGGGTWANVGPVSGAGALLLKPSDFVRMAPNGMNGTTGSISYYGWDQTSGSEGSKVDVSDFSRGGSSSFSLDSATSTIIVIAVNDPPVVTVPGGQTTAEDTPITISGVTVTDVDANATAAPDNMLQVTLGVNNGTIHLGSIAGLGFTIGGNDQSAMTFIGDLASVDAALHDLQYTPAGNYNGPDALTVTATDLGHTGAGAAPNITKSVGITVTAVNDAPVVVVPGDTVMNEDTGLVVDGIVVQDIDAAEGTGKLQVTVSVDHGVIALAGTAGIAFAPGDANGTSHMTFVGLPADLNAALTNLKYTPSLNYFGPDAITLEVNDLGNTGAPGEQTATGKVNLTVIDVPEPVTDEGPAGRPIVDGPAALGAAFGFGEFHEGGTIGTVDIGGAEDTLPISFGAWITGGGTGPGHHTEVGPGHVTGEGAGPVNWTGIGGPGGEGFPRPGLGHDLASGSPLNFGWGSDQMKGVPDPGLTGLANYAENLLAGKLLVFNLEDMRFADLCTDCVLPPSSHPDIPTGLAGYYEAIKTGKVLVFNMDEMNCVDLICSVGGQMGGQADTKRS